MSKIYIACLLLFVSFSSKMQAQQAAHYTQYYYNMQILNPAYVGVKSDLSIVLLQRQQWVGIEGAPKTNTFSINGRTQNGLGIGTTVINDKIGLAESTNINIDAAYTIATSYYGRVSVGIKGGLTLFTNKLAQGITPDNDVYLSTKGRFPTAGFGGLYYNDKFYIGLSLPNLLKFSSFKTNDTFSESNGVSNKNYFLTGGSIFHVSETLKFKPSAIFKYTPSLPISFDVNGNFTLNDQFEIGFSYRFKKSISALAMFVISEKVKIGYAYDYQLNNLGDNFNSHEIILSLNLNLDRDHRWLYHHFCCP